jgi:hypothetical protein
MRKELRTYYDAVTGMSYRVNVRTGVVCASDGTYPDHKTEVRIRSAVASRVKAGAARRNRDQSMRDIGMVKVRGALGGTYWE